MTEIDHAEVDRKIAEYTALGRAMLAANPPPPPPTVHYTELPEMAGGALTTEWNFYRHEAGRLLAEGHEGRWVLIVGEQVIGIWDTEFEASVVAADRYLRQPVLIHHILTREPLRRAPNYFFRRRLSPSPPLRAAG